MSPQELLENPKLSLGTAAAKARLAARLGGGELAVKADDSLRTAVEFRTAGGKALSQENAVARFIAVATQSGLYPLPPFDDEKRCRAGQIDAWIDFAALSVQLRLRKILGAPSAQVGGSLVACSKWLHGSHALLTRCGAACARCTCAVTAPQGCSLTCAAAALACRRQRRRRSCC
jgi:hypothetical protein